MFKQKAASKIEHRRNKQRTNPHRYYTDTYTYRACLLACVASQVDALESSVLTHGPGCRVAPVLASSPILVTRRQEPLSETTSAHHLALTEHDIAKVAARAAALQSTEAHKLTVISERPVLHQSTPQSKYSCTNSGSQRLSKVRASVSALIVPKRRHYYLTLSRDALAQLGS